MPVLVAPAALGGALRAPVVAAAIARGLERAGVSPPPDRCPLAGGGPGTIEVLLPVLGGETADGFALIEDGGTAIVEPGPTPRETGRRIGAAVDARVELVLVAAAGNRDSGAGAGVVVVEEIEAAGGLRGSGLALLCETREARGGRPSPASATAAGDRGLVGALAARYGAPLVAGPAFVLEQLGFDARMRAARAVVVGEARLERATLAGRVAGEAAFRARQAGVPCHAVTAQRALDRFDARILDLQAIVEASTIEELEAAGEQLARFL